jgi:hypothetical protein
MVLLSGGFGGGGSSERKIIGDDVEGFIICSIYSILVITCTPPLQAAKGSFFTCALFSPT